MLRSPLPAVNDTEGESVPPGLPPVVDAHVHVFPDHLSASIQGWFDRHGWPIRYRLKAGDVASFLLSRGVGRVVIMCYAHRPGVSRSLNRFMASIAGRDPRIIALGTVFPGEAGVREILKEAFYLGLAGVKLHAHVQCIPVDAPETHEVAVLCEEHNKPLVLHAGREPRSPAYACDPHEICGARRVRRLIKDHPGLKLCVPHLGMDEYDAHCRLIEEYDNLWLDTTMALAGYFPGAPAPPLKSFRSDRVLYGTDFPNLPYAWDRELRRLIQWGLADRDLALILGENALRLFCVNP
ncbi:MAG: amidohydrolase family protein [Thermodesulfobacteriota bacterium]